MNVMQRYASPLALALVLVAGGCASQPPGAAPTVAGTPQPQSAEWKYPELSGTRNNWVEEYGYQECAASYPMQSPIALDPATADTRSGWKLPNELHPTPFSQALVGVADHNNYEFDVSPGDIGLPLTIQWSRGSGPITTWTFEKFHFHVPAEHAVEGQAVSVLEMHVKAAGMQDGHKIAGVFAVQFAASNGAQRLLEPVARFMEGDRTQRFDLTPFLKQFQAQPTFIYNGSLTTPPCTAGVLFFVLQNPVPVDSISWQSIARSLLRLNGVSNVRPLQTLRSTDLSRVKLVKP